MDHDDDDGSGLEVVVVKMEISHVSHEEKCDKRFECVFGENKRQATAIDDRWTFVFVLFINGLWVSSVPWKRFGRGTYRGSNRHDTVDVDGAANGANCR